MDQVLAAPHRQGRVRRRHKKRTAAPVKFDSNLFMVAVIIAVLAGLVCVWLMMQPANRPEALEMLQMVLLGALGLHHRLFIL